MIEMRRIFKKSSIFENFLSIIHLFYIFLFFLKLTTTSNLYITSKYNERRERGRGAPSPCKRDHMGIFFVESALTAFRNLFPKTKRFA